MKDNSRVALCEKVVSWSRGTRGWSAWPKHVLCVSVWIPSSWGKEKRPLPSSLLLSPPLLTFPLLLLFSPSLLLSSMGSAASSDLLIWSYGRLHLQIFSVEESEEGRGVAHRSPPPEVWARSSLLHSAPGPRLMALGTGGPYLGTLPHKSACVLGAQQMWRMFDVLLDQRPWGSEIWHRGEKKVHNSQK